MHTPAPSDKSKPPPELLRWGWLLLLSYWMGSYLFVLGVMAIFSLPENVWLATAPLSLPVMGFMYAQRTGPQGVPFFLSLLLTWWLSIAVAWWVIEMIRRGRWLFWPWLFMAAIALVSFMTGAMLMAGR